MAATLTFSDAEHVRSFTGGAGQPTPETPGEPFRPWMQSVADAVERGE